MSDPSVPERGTNPAPLPPTDLSAASAAAALLSAHRTGERAVLLLALPEEGGAVHPSSPPLPGLVGRRLLVIEDRVRGSLGDPALDARGHALARQAMEGEAREGVHALTLEAGRTVRVYLEVHAPPGELVIVGAGHIARPLCTMGALMGFRVIILDDRPDFATRERFPEAERVVRADFADPFAVVPLGRRSHIVLVTRGHKYDYECLRHLLATDPEPAYIGMIGSRRRVRATFVQLVREGFSRERIAQIRAPVGLDLGAQTPAEIAVSIAGEIVLLAKGGEGRPLRDVERVAERFLDEPEE